jgi:type II secretory pathway predicted ATPase ExeA
MGIFAALDQRIATRCHIKAMDLAESMAYLRHHLGLVGRDEPLFDDDAVAPYTGYPTACPEQRITPPPPRSSRLPQMARNLVDDACAKNPSAELALD